MVKVDQMAQIDVRIDRSLNLTEFIISGPTTSAELLATVQEFWEDEPTKYAMWDLLLADFQSFNASDMSKVAEYTQKQAHKRPGGRTAFAVSSDFMFGMTRMYEIISDVTAYPIEHRIFRDVSEAREWLLKNTPQ